MQFLKSLSKACNLCTSMLVITIPMLTGCGGGGNDGPPALVAVGISSPLSTTIEIGQTENLSAEGLYSDHSTRDLTSQVTWSSSDTAVATIDSTGLVSALANGTANISASMGGFTSNTDLLTVVLGEPRGMVLAFSTGAISVGWNPVPGATSYNLYWATTAGVTTASTNVGGVTAPYSHTVLTDGTYYYRVSAVNASAETLSLEMASCPYVGGDPVCPP